MILNTQADPMGQAIADYYEKNEVLTLHVDSNITEDEEIEVEYLFRSFDQMPEIEQKALGLCTGSVLDVGAAAGIHSLYLQNNGMEVTALDYSSLAANVMEKQGVKKVLCDDFFELKDLKFDTLLCLMNGIGISGTIKGLEAFFAQCKMLLTNSGQVLLDSTDISYMFEDEDMEIEFDYYYGELEYQMQYGAVEGEPFNWLFIDFDTLKEKAQAAGFKCEKVLDGSHLDYLARLTIL